MSDNNNSKKTNSENDSSSKIFSLQNIIISVLNENNITNDKTVSFESYVKSLYRRFISLIEIMGGDINMLKHGKKYSFTEDEVPFMKAIISQLYKGKGVIADIIDNHKADKVFSAKEVNNFIQEIIDETDRAGDDEETLKKWLNFFKQSSLFHHIIIGNNVIY